MEGAYDEDGRGLSVQDVYETSESITDFKEASDHYHHMKKDVKLMAEMGMKAYRFTIAWESDCNKQRVRVTVKMNRRIKERNRMLRFF